MESANITLCFGCLCPDRKITELLQPNTKDCFSQIISEFSITEEEIPIWLCWECEARVKSFTKFKQQVKSSYFSLKTYKKTSKLPQWNSNLTAHYTHSISIPDIVNTEVIDNIKEETIDIDYNEDFVSDIKEFTPEPELLEKKEVEITKISPKSKKVKIKKKKRKRKEFKEVYLSREQIEEERNKSRNREEYVNSIFKCDLCILVFPNAEDLKDHSNDKHKEQALQCDICHCTFNNVMSVKYHVNKHSRRYICKCDERFRSKIAVKKHIEYYHRSSIQKVDTNDTENENLEDSNNIIEISEDARFPCDVCNKTFRWKTSLRKHIETHRIESGQKRKPYCETCRLSFSNTANLQKHVKTSSKHQIQLKLIKLRQTQPVEAASSAAFIQEIAASVNSSKQLYTCSLCGKGFQWKGNLSRHVSSHMARAKRDIVCEPCNKTFSSLATYKHHLKTSKKHVSEKDLKYVCLECDKRFTTRARLRDHTNYEHLKNFVHTCPFCQKVFSGYTSLYLHKQAFHIKTRQDHLCDHCGKAFRNNNMLRAHINAVHGAGCAYRCASCGARFNWHSCLIRHVKNKHSQSN